VLRLAALADVDLVAELMAEFYQESGFTLEPVRGRAAIHGLVADASRGRLWLIEQDGATAGYVALTFGWSLEYLGRDAFIDDLYLRAPFRGRGLGTRVMAEVEAEARSHDVQALHLEVGRDNRAGLALYFRRGFRDNDRQLLSKRL
jgi:ribosomal protein S18 acetylase RimI-like enzyme